MHEETKAGSFTLPFSMSRTCAFCYVSKILTVGSEPVISFFNKGKSISQGLPFFAFL
jgi:hypothetical protein